MNLPANLADGLWAGLFSLAMAAVFSAPYYALIPSFCCGFLDRVARDVLMGWGVAQAPAVAAAAALTVILAVVLVRRSTVPPVVMVSGLLPLGAAGSFFAAIGDFLRVGSVTGGAAVTVPLDLVLKLSMVFTTTLAIAAGAWVGFQLSRVVGRREAPW